MKITTGTVVGRFLLTTVLFLLTSWGTLALYFSELDKTPPLNSVLALFFGVAGAWAVVSLIALKNKTRPLILFSFLFMVLLAWWFSLEPSNFRDWQVDVKRLASAEINGDLVTVHNIRNFDYQSETDYTPAYYDKIFDVSQLTSVDLVAVYWMGPDIAHTFLSFGFDNDDYLAISIETRKEKTESYSTIKGFFKQYELYYVVADERDVIRLRTNYRNNPPEDVYVYRAQGPIENGRRLFLEYIHRINQLKEKPEFYNTLIDNCTTGIWINTGINPGHVPLSWKILASGHVPEYLYEVGKLDNSLSFSELQSRSLVNKRAQATDQAENFSVAIREGLPGMKVVNSGSN